MRRAGGRPAGMKPRLRFSSVERRINGAEVSPAAPWAKAADRSAKPSTQRVPASTTCHADLAMSFRKKITMRPPFETGRDLPPRVEKLGFSVNPRSEGPDKDRG